MKVGDGLGGLLMLQDIDGWYECTLTWGGRLILTWFIDRKNGLYGISAIQAVLLVDGDTLAELKQTFHLASTTSTPHGRSSSGRYDDRGKSTKRFCLFVRSVRISIGIAPVPLCSKRKSTKSQRPAQ
jgi:hypothetical protein